VATFALTRAEHEGEGAPGTTPKHTPIAPVVLAALVTGARIGHLLALEWPHVDLDALDEHGNPVGEIVPPEGSQTKRTGVVGLEISPALRKMLAAMRLASGGKGRVFRLTRGEADAALKRLRAEYGAPMGSTWQAFRRTCGCFLTNAPGIFGAASAYRSAKQLGHSVQVAERHYVGVVRGIPREASSVEAAMQTEGQAARVVAAVSKSRHRVETAIGLRSVG
jgi:integrase